MGAFLQGNELLILLVILLLILGPSKLPQLARALGQAVHDFRRAMQGEIRLEEQSASPARGTTAGTRAEAARSDDNSEKERARREVTTR